jgi:hypothetical protein
VAVVGDAYIVVRAITTGFEAEVNRALRRANAASAGQNVGRSFQQGFSRQLTGARGLLGDFGDEALAANEKFRRLVTTGYFVGPALSAAAAAIGALGAGLVVLTAQLSAALPSLIVLPGILSAIVQAGLTAKLAFGGVGKAIAALGKGAKGAGKDTENALKRIQDAEKRLARTIEQNEERLERATRTLTEAQDNLTKANERAAESLQQLNFDAEDAAISEKKAALELERARETLARVQDLPPNTRARRQAELAFAEADLNLRRARDRNADLTKETEKRNALGVAGSEEVVNATQAVTDAQIAKERAERDALRAQEDATEALEEAKKAAKEAAGGVNAIADAMKDLSPEAQRFARYIAGLKPILLELRAAAGRQLFLPLELGIQNLIDKLLPRLLPLIEETGGALGRAFTDFSNIITEPQVVTGIESIFKNNIKVIEKFGSIIGNIVGAFVALLDAAGPLILEFATWIDTLTRGWRESLELKNRTGALADTFAYAGEVAKQLGRILRNIWDALMNIGRAAAGPGSAGEMLFDSFEKVTEKFKEFTGALLESGRLEEYFKNTVPVVESIGRFLVEIVKQLLLIGENKGATSFFDSLTQAISNIGGALLAFSDSLPAFGQFIERFTEFIALFAESESIKNFFDTLTGALDIVIAIFSNETVEKVFMFVVANLAFLKALTLVKNVLKFVFLAFAGYFVKIAQFVAFVPKVAAAFKIFSVRVGIAGGGLKGLVGVLSSFAAVKLAVIIAAIAAVAAVLYLVWTRSEKFREAIGALVDAVMGALKEAWETIKVAIEDVMPVFQGAGDMFKSIGDFLAVTLVPILQFVLVGAIKTVASTIAGFIRVVGGIITIFKSVWDFIKGFFALLRGDTDRAAELFKSAFKNLVGGLKLIFAGIKDIIFAPFKAGFSLVAKAWNRTLGKIEFTVPDWVKYTGVGALIANKTFKIPSIPEMAEGGTIMPRAGGSIVRVAEAGRAERIEPLDPDGLSKRDKAIISMLSGGGSSQTFNVYPSPGMDEAELAAMISRQLAFQLRAGAA